MEISYRYFKWGGMDYYYTQFTQRYIARIAFCTTYLIILGE